MFTKEREALKRKFIRQNKVIVERAFNKYFNEETHREFGKELIKKARKCLKYADSTVDGDILIGLRRAKERME